MTAISAFGRDIRTALRTLRKNMGSTATAILTLALGIGANTAIFSLTEAVVLRPLPIPHPEQLVVLATTIADDRNGDQPFSLQMFNELRRGQKVFSDIFAWNGGSIESFEADSVHHTAAVATVSGNYYRTIGIQPLLGRFIRESDVAVDSGQSDPVAVVSYRVWRGWYGGRADIIGAKIRMGARVLTIIGVEPEGYNGLVIDSASDVTVPIYYAAKPEDRVPRLLSLRLYGRLKPGVTNNQARSSLLALWPHVQEATRPPGYEGERRTRFFARRITLDPASTGVSMLRKRFAPSLRVLLALVCAVLLIACLNLANLSLARSALRAGETGIRNALGASTFDLVRQPLTESLLISIAGAALGLALAALASRALLRVAWTGLIATPLQTSLNWKVLLFTASLTVLTTLITAAAPAVYAARSSPLSAMKGQSRSVRGGAVRFGKVLLIAQIALSSLLVAGALLFTQTLRRLHNEDVGYRRDHLLTLLLFGDGATFEPREMPAYYQELTARVKRVAGVESVSFSGYGPANQFETLRQVYDSPNGSPLQVVEEMVGPEFFHVAGMRLLQGREFTWRDDEHEPVAAIISDSLAKKLYGNSDPIGRVIYTGPHTYLEKLKIAGVVNSASLWKIESRQPMAVYRPIAMDYHSEQPLMDVRTTVHPNAVKAEVERAVRSLGRQYPLRTVTVDERLDSYLAVQRLMSMVSVFFGILAVLIAAVGLYGLMSFHVSGRTAELGIRFALGAQRGDVLSMVLREALTLAGLGCVAGLLAILLLGRYASSLFYSVSASDPGILAAAILILALATVLAALLPARRASSIDPVTALRAE